MQIMTSPISGELIRASHSLGMAQRYAGDVLNDRAQSPQTHARLNAAIHHATDAVSELFLAKPRSEYQNLALAREHVMHGQALLEQAIDGAASKLQLLTYTSKAFDLFEDAFEVIDNY